MLWSESGYIYYGRVIYNVSSSEYRVTGKENTNVNIYVDGVSTWFAQPRACVRRDGQTVHFVWGETLKHAWRSTSGAWSKETVRGISGVQRCIAPSVVVENNETVHVLYGYYDGSNGYDPTHLIYQRKPAGGAWSGTMEFDVAGYNQGAEWRDPVMTLDANGGIHATWSNFMYWQTEYGGAARYRYAPAGTGLETASTLIVPRASDVVTNGAGNIYVDATGKVHRTMSTSLVSLDYSSKPSGASGSWAVPSRPSIGLLQTGEDSWASLTSDGSGRVLVAFADGTDYSNYPNLYCSLLSQGVWTKYSVSTSASLSHFRQPSLVTANGTIVLLWRENSSQLFLGTAADTSTPLNVTSPAGGEVWMRGESRTITWSPTGASGPLAISLRLASAPATKVLDIATSTENDGSFSWSIPSTLVPGSYLVRVQTVSTTPLVYDDSAAFTIASSGPLAVITPARGETWARNETRTITWNPSSVSGPMAILLRLANAPDAPPVFTISSGTENDGTFSWTIPDTVVPGSYLVRVRTVSTSPLVYDDGDPFAIVESGTLTVTTPAGGESWALGESRTLTWASTNVSGPLAISLRLASAPATPVLDIAASTENDGSFSWAIPATLAPGSYLVRVQTVSTSPLVYDDSAAFSIVGGGTLTVTTPAGGESWTAGQTRVLAWTSTNVSGALSISLRQASAPEVSVLSISASTENDGAFSWAIPATLAPGSYLVRLQTVSTSPLVYDDSAAFSIVVGGPLTVTAPAGGETWPLGGTRDITWSPSTVSGPMSIKLRLAGQPDAPPVLDIAASTENDGSFSWTIPATLAPGSYLIRVRTVSTSPLVYDDSEAFTIASGGSLTVTSPAGGESWAQGESRPITWTSSGVSGALSISLRQAGAPEVPVLSISASTENDGAFSWAIPATLAPGSYLVRVQTVSTTPLVYDDSAAFTVTSGGPLAVTTPAGGETWAVGETRTIAWNPSTVSGPMSIKLRLAGQPDAPPVLDIAASTENDGAFSWAIPTTLAPGSYLVRVRTVSTSPLVYDDSEAFTIVVR